MSAGFLSSNIHWEICETFPQIYHCFSTNYCFIQLEECVVKKSRDDLDVAIRSRLEALQSSIMLDTDSLKLACIAQINEKEAQLSVAVCGERIEINNGGTLVGK